MGLHGVQQWQSNAGVARSTAQHSGNAHHGASTGAPADLTARSTAAAPQAHKQAAKAIAAWHRVGRKGRGVLKKMSVHRVHELEEQVTDFVSSVRIPPFLLCCACSDTPCGL